ncbi:MAG: insulinase family protein, partial [Armatimonadota bacterium]
RVQRRAPAGADVARVRTQVEAAEVFGQETAEGRAESLGANLLITGDVNFSERYVAGIRGVTPRAVQQVAASYLRPERTCVAILRPPGDEPAGPTATAPVAPARTHQRTLRNGLRVVVRENHVIPIVSVTTATLAGLRYETDETAGITSLMAEMLTRGTRKYSRERMAERVDRLGGTLSTYAGRNSFGVSAQFLAREVDAALELCLEALFRPTFPPDELERQRQLTLAAIERQEDDVETVAFRELLQELFVAHPIRYLPVGTAESVAALTVQDVTRFHAAYARPPATAVVVAGDVNPEHVFAQVERLTADLPADPQQPPTPPAEPPLQQRRERTVERAQQQAIVAYGFRGLTVTDPRRDVLDVLDAILSGVGMPGGRLHEALRGAELVYFAHGMPLLGLDTGAFVIYAGTSPDKVATVQATIESVLSEIAAAPPSAEELARGKQMAITAERMGLQTNSALAQTIALDVIYGLGADRWESYDERIGAVTAEQVQQLARELLDLQRVAVVLTKPRAAQ